MKYQIETEHDYVAYLHGKIMLVANELSYDAYQKADEWLNRSHPIERLEGYLEGLLELLYESDPKAAARFGV